MSKRKARHGGHLAAVPDAPPPGPRPDCPACEGTGTVYDQHGVACVCVPCGLGLVGADALRWRGQGPVR